MMLRVPVLLILATTCWCTLVAISEQEYGTSIYSPHKTDKQEVDPGTKLIKKFLIEYLRECRQVPEVINRDTNHF